MRKNDNMSELIDFRTKVTQVTDAYLDAVSNATGDDKSSIVRDILHAYASQKIHEHKLMEKTLTSKGFWRDS